MMHVSKLSRVRSLKLVLAASLALSAFGSARVALASSTYPPKVQEALNTQFPGQSYCVPQCITCHLTNEGGFGTLNVFGKNLQLNGRLPAGKPDAVVGAFDTYFKSTPAMGGVSTTFLNGTTRLFYDSDSDGISDYTELQEFNSPSTPGNAGVDQLCPSDAAQYGCFARVAAAPPPATVDRLGLFSAGLVVLGLAAFRRSKRRRRDS